MKAKSLIILIVICYLFTSCNSNKDKFEYDVLPVKSGEKWGYIDKEGKYVVNPQFDNAMLFSEGIACVEVDNKFGYISEDGKYLINPIYKDATYFSEGLAGVVIENGYPSYIDKKGEIKFTMNNAERCRVFSEGLAAVLIKNKWGFINSSGEIVIQPQYEFVSDFSNGLAVFSQKVKNEVLKGYINTKGEIVINAQFKNAYDFNNDLALINMNEKWGFINTEGKIIINPQFENADFFAEDLCVIKQGDNYGFIDKTGKIIINPQFKQAGSFSEKLAVVKSSDDKYGYINKEGKYEINPQFEEAGNFTKGIAYIKIGEKYGFIDNKGKIIVNPQFDEIYGWRSYNSTVESDYFDSENFFSLFLKNTSQQSVRGITKETTLKELVDNEHKGSQLSEESRYSVNVKDEVIVNEYAKISNLVYSFYSKIYSLVPQYDYSYYYGYYNTGNKKNYNFNAKVSGVKYTLELSGKAFNKADNIKKALVTKFSKILNTQSVKVAEKETIENDNMKVTVYSESDYLTSKVDLEIEFK